MRIRLPAILGALLLSSSLMAQCIIDTAAIGSPFLVSTGLNNTPFPTSEGRGARVQYLIPSMALMAMGLCPGTDITGIALHVVDDDVPGTITTIELEMKNTSAPCVNAVEQTALQMVTQGYQTHIDSGLMVIPFNTSSFSWTGAGFNLLLDISIFRNEIVGASPRVAIDTSFHCSARYHYDSGGAVPGWDLNESNSTFITEDYLPVIELIGQYASLPEGQDDVDGPPAVPNIYPNPTGHEVTIRRNGSWAVGSVLQMMDASGRPVRKIPIDAGSPAQLTVRLEGIAPGLYHVIEVLATGEHLKLGSAVVE